MEMENELMCLSYQGRTVLTSYHPVLEDAKYSVLQDLGLDKAGFTTQDLAFTFHPNDDEKMPLLEVLPSAWPKLRPVPRLVVQVRPPSLASPALSSPGQVSPVQPQPNTHVQHHPHYQHVHQPYMTNLMQQAPTSSPDMQSWQQKTLVSQSSDATFKASFHQPQRREYETSAGSGSESSDSAMAPDIETWRTQAVHPYSMANSHQQPILRLQPQQPILLPHALPSPPVSENQSLRTSSPHTDGMCHSTQSSRPQSLEVDAHVQFNMLVDEQLETSNKYLEQISSHHAQSSGRADSGHHNGSRRVDHSSSGHSSSPCSSSTSPTSGLPCDNAAPAPSHSPTAFQNVGRLLGVGKQQLSSTTRPGPLSEGGRRASLQSDMRTRSYHPRPGRSQSQHNQHNLGQPAGQPKILSPTPVRRTNSQDLLHGDYSMPAATPTENSARTAMFSQPGQPRQRSEPPTMSSSTRDVRRTALTGQLHDNEDASKPSTIRRFTETVGVSDRVKKAGAAALPMHVRIQAPLHRAVSSSHLVSSRNAPSGPPPMLPALGSPDVFDSLDRAMGRRASMPDATHVHRQSQKSPLGANESHGHTVRFQDIGEGAAWSATDVDMAEATASDTAKQDYKQDSGAVSPLTPKKRLSNQTIRRLKSSPSGLREQYKWGTQANAERSGQSDDDMPSLKNAASSTKRGPTSWPNSPVKRNASFTTASFRQDANDCFQVQPFPLPPADSPPQNMGSLPEPLPPLVSSAGRMLLPAFTTEESRADLKQKALHGPVGAFLLDKRRPDSPMPPLHRSLPASPVSMSTTVSNHKSTLRPSAAAVLSFSAGKRTFSHSPISPSFTNARPRTRSMQSEEHSGDTTSHASASFEQQALSKPRSHASLTKSAMSRRTRTT